MSASIPTDYPRDADGWIDAGLFEPDVDTAAGGFEVTVCSNGQEPWVVQAFWWPHRGLQRSRGPVIAVEGSKGGWHYAAGPMGGMKIEELPDRVIGWKPRVIGWKPCTPPMMRDRPPAEHCAIPTPTGYIPWDSGGPASAARVISAMIERNAKMRDEWAQSDARARVVFDRMSKS